MSKLIFDLESNGLLDTVTCIHCLVTKDTDTGVLRRFRAHDGTLAEGLALLEQAEELIGHNILSFDLPALKKVYPLFKPKGRVLDTLVCSRVIWTDMYDRDCRSRLPPALRGRHSLESWGYRVGKLKGTFGKTGTDEENEKVWEHWSQEMEDYCARDVEVTEVLWKIVQSKNYSSECLEIEHRFREIIDMQERHGFRFNVEAARKLTAELQKKRYEIERELQQVFPARIETMKTPEYYEALGFSAPTKGALIAQLREAGYKGKALSFVEIKPGPLKTKEHPFNPGSRQQVADRLKERYGWEPTEFTETGEVKVSEEILEGLDWPEAKKLCDYYVVTKTLGMVSDGDGGCLRLVRNGRIHGSVNTAGAVSGRCTHSKPNVAQTPKVVVRKIDGKPTILRGLEGRYGYDFRALYMPDFGHTLVGWDASGLELRCLAHYMAVYDGGAYGRILLEGDIHTTNQEAAGLHLRDSAKTFIYALLYGAGDEKIGSIVVDDARAAGKPVPKGDLRKLGKTLKARFFAKLPALGRLKEGIDQRVDKRGYLIGLDGRKLHIRSKHSALNTLLQSCGAILMKRALINQYDILTIKHGLTWGRDFAFVANIHDEVQTTCRPEFAEVVGKSGPEALRIAGEKLRFRCPLDGEYKIGPTWADTH